MTTLVGGRFAFFCSVVVGNEGFDDLEAAEVSVSFPFFFGSGLFSRYNFYSTSKTYYLFSGYKKANYF